MNISTLPHRQYRSKAFVLPPSHLTQASYGKIGTGWADSTIWTRKAGAYKSLPTHCGGAGPRGCHTYYVLSIFDPKLRIRIPVPARIHADYDPRTRQGASSAHKQTPDHRGPRRFYSWIQIFMARLPKLSIMATRTRHWRRRNSGARSKVRSSLSRLGTRVISRMNVIWKIGSCRKNYPQCQGNEGYYLGFVITSWLWNQLVSIGYLALREIDSQLHYYAAKFVVLPLLILITENTKK